MVLLDYVVGIFDMQDFDQPESPVQNQQVIHVLKSGEICPAFVDHNSFGEAVVTDRACEERRCRSFISVLQEHEIKGFPELVDSAVIVGPLAFHLDISPIHPLGNGRWSLLGTGVGGDQRRVLHDPSVQRRMIKGHATLSQNLFQVAI